MRALTLQQPWAHAIVTGFWPRCFYMRWSTKHRGQIAIHAAKKVYPDISHMMECEHNLKSIYRSAIVGVINLVDVIPDETSEGFWWLYEEESIIRFATPITGVKGQQGLWNLPEWLERVVDIAIHANREMPPKVMVVGVDYATPGEDCSVEATL